MATLDALKQALRETATSKTASSSAIQLQLSDEQYSAGFDILVRGSGWMTYHDFIIPQLSQQLVHLFNLRGHISVLEIRPGPKSILGHLPHRLRRKVKKYAAFEPNDLFATSLEAWLRSPWETNESPLPCLESLPDIHRAPFGLDSSTSKDGDEKFDVVLFCHSIYDTHPQHSLIRRALEMLGEPPEAGIVLVFHRGGTLNLDSLVCHQTASFPTGVIRVRDHDDVLDPFSAFIAEFAMQDLDADKALRVEWRKLCRALGHREESHSSYLLFNSPEVMFSFNRHATALPELAAQVPIVQGDMTIENREARLHRPAAIVRPTEIGHIQQCVRWALEHKVSLTIVGGSHSGHCLWPGVVAVDMSVFNRVHIIRRGDDGTEYGLDFYSGPGSFVVVEAGCKTGDVIRRTMAAGLTLPLGARPSVGAGSWLQGGIGHLSRLRGLASDTMVGAVVASVSSGQIFCLGHVPSQHWPAGAVRPDNASDLFWAVRGAGTGFGIVLSVIFKAYAAPNYVVRNWVVPLRGKDDSWHKLTVLDSLVARDLPYDCSVDAYLYWDADHLHVGVTMFESYTDTPALETTSALSLARSVLGPESNSKVVDSVGLFDTEMYMSGMHGGHGGGKTSSFKRCLLLKRFGTGDIGAVLTAAVENRPSPLCYIYVVQGGGGINHIPAKATAFGCRDWEYACVITGVWPREQDGTECARAAVRWVYDIAMKLLPLSAGVYGADLGPDPRDAPLAARAFGPNRPRLVRLKNSADPHNLLAYTCPLPRSLVEQKLVLLFTGESCAGKDYCADILVSFLTTHPEVRLTARAVSISDVTKREYAAATGVDLNRLLWDRAYKEKHRAALTAFFEAQVRWRPRLPEDHLSSVVYSNLDADVLIITGVRDAAPVASFSHLVPEYKFLEIRVEASEETRRARRGDGGGHHEEREQAMDANPTAPDCLPNLTLHNNVNGDEAVKRLAERHLLPFFHDDLQRLADMVRRVPNFPRPGIEFRHVLDIAQQRGGLTLCTSLLQTHFTGDWTKVDAVACCEAGGFVFASALAARVDVPLALMRDTGKLPPPIVSTSKSPSHIASSTIAEVEEELPGKPIELGKDVVPRGGSVVVVDDVFATGQTLLAVLHLLGQAGVSTDDISVIVVAEFPMHGGRAMLRTRGFGRVGIQSLLVFNGA